MHYDWIVAGLGNPGARYQFTRHNIGWLVCEELLRRHKQRWSAGKGEFMHSSLRIHGKSVLVVLPTTYMNNSGSVVAPLLITHKIPPDRLMIVVDEYNFPVGRVHIRRGGSDGGHNGVRSVIDEVRNEQFWRLRCGIDKNFGDRSLVEYVLREFEPQEISLRDAMIIRATDAIELMMKAGAARAPSFINAEKEPTAKQ